MINSENERSIIHLKTSYHLAINYQTIYYIYLRVSISCFVQFLNLRENLALKDKYKLQVF